MYIGLTTVDIAQRRVFTEATYVQPGHREKLRHRVVCNSHVQVIYSLIEVETSPPQSFGKSASLPLTAENGLARFVCY